MGVRKATGFLTSDGKFFGPQEESAAQQHEMLFRLKEFSRAHLIRDPNDRELAQLLFNHRDELLRIFNGLDEPGTNHSDLAERRSTSHLTRKIRS